VECETESAFDNLNSLISLLTNSVVGRHKDDTEKRVNGKQS
jgi:hypothetical protein